MLIKIKLVMNLTEKTDTVQEVGVKNMIIGEIEVTPPKNITVENGIKVTIYIKTR